MMKSKLLFCLSGGGHTEQCIRLVKKLGNYYDYEYVIEKGDELSLKKIKKNGKIFFISRPRKYGQNIFFSIPYQIKCLFQALKIIKKSKAIAVISFGASFSPYISILGKIKKKKNIFIETWSRVKTTSLSGRINYYLSDLFFVQWKQQKEKYPKAIYVGRLG